MPKDPNEIGALWVKSSAKGEYMTGEIGGVKVVCFANKTGNEKAPQWRVLKSQPRDAKPAPDQPPAFSDDDVRF